MIEYIAKSSLLLFVFYLLFLLLQKENNLKFNRFYLITSVLFSLLLPLFHFDFGSSQVIEFPSEFRVAENINTATAVANEPKVIEQSSGFDYGYFISLVYIAIVICLAFRFALNLIRLFSKIRKSDKKIHGYNLVLLDKKVNIHSFINSIFVNASDFEQNRIDNHLIEHELTHLKQHHTIDVIFIELVLIFNWFNPLVYLFRSAIKTNHEYLADAGVNITHDQLKTYSEKIINYTFGKNKINLASEFSYSLIKKRLLMLGKHKSNTIKLPKLLLVSAFTVSALVILPSFSFNTINKPLTQQEAVKKIDKMYKNAKYHVGALGVIKAYAEHSSYNFDTYVLLAELASKPTSGTSLIVKVADITWNTDCECDLLNEIAPLFFTVEGMKREEYLSLAEQASRAKTESELKKVKRKIEQYKKQVATHERI